MEILALLAQQVIKQNSCAIIVFAVKAQLKSPNMHCALLAMNFSLHSQSMTASKLKFVCFNI